MTEKMIKCSACGKETESKRHKNGYNLCIGCSNLCRDFEEHGYELFYRRLSEKIRQYKDGGLTEERLEKEKDRLLQITDEDGDDSGGEDEGSEFVAEPVK